MSNITRAERIANRCEGLSMIYRDAAAELRRLAKSERALLEALEYAEAALADIGDADREPGDDLEWCEGRAAEALPRVRAMIAATKEARNAN